MFDYSMVHRMMQDFFTPSGVGEGNISNTTGDSAPERRPASRVFVISRRQDTATSTPGDSANLRRPQPRARLSLPACRLPPAWHAPAVHRTVSEASVTVSLNRSIALTWRGPEGSFQATGRSKLTG